MNSHSNKIIEVAKELLRQFGYFVDNLWHVDDVHFICDQKELPRISDAEAMEVFVIAKEQFDGEHGISWPQLDKALRIYMHQKNVLVSMCESAAA
jgi:hypothetical protein